MNNIFLENSQITLDKQDKINQVVSSEAGGIFEKMVSSSERAVYKILEKYRQQFLEQNPRIVFPLLRKEGLNSLIITSPPLFDSSDMSGKSEDYYLIFLNSLDIMRRVFDKEEFSKLQEDPDRKSGYFSFITDTFKSLPEEIQSLFNETPLITLLIKSQEFIEDLPLLPCHGDAHGENFSISLLNEMPVVSFIDLETMGNFRRGWDEARCYSLLSGHVQDQQNLLDAIENSQHFSEVESIYFWRTVATRSLRSLYLLVNKLKKYEPLDSNQREQLVQSNIQTAQQAIQELSLILHTHV